MTTTNTLQVTYVGSYDLVLDHIAAANLPNFVPDPPVETKNGRSCTYRYSAGDARDTLTMTASRFYSEKQDMTFNRIVVSGLVKTVVTETGEETYSPIEGSVGWNHSGRVTVDADFAVVMASIAFHIFAQELTGANGSPTSKIVDQFDHDVLTLLAG